MTRDTDAGASRCRGSSLADVPETDHVGKLNGDECSEIVCIQPRQSERHDLFRHFE